MAANDRLYHGCASIRRIGEAVPRSECSTDAAEALVRAWETADRDQYRIPHLYAVGDADGALRIIEPVLPDGAIIWRALIRGG